MQVEQGRKGGREVLTFLRGLSSPLYILTKDY